jgi:O-antigen/teichoic acid export membrane protein
MSRAKAFSTMSYGAARITSALVGVAAVPIYTSLLSLADYGAYALAFSVVSVLNAVLFHWITAATARVYPSHLDDIPGFVGLVMHFWFRSVISLAVLTLLALLVAPPGSSALVVASCVLLITTSLHEFGLELCRSALRPGSYAIAIAVYAFVGLAAGTAFAVAGAGATAPLWGLAAGQFCSFMALRRLGLVKVRREKDSVRKAPLIRHMLGYGLPLSIALVVSMMLASVDRYMIENFLGLEKVAMYAATYALVFPGVTLLASVINLSGYPKIMRAVERGDGHDANRLLSQQITALLVVLAPLCIAVIAMTPVLELDLPRGRYSEGLPLLPYVALAASLNAIRSTYVDIALHISKRVAWLVGSLLAGLTVGVMINIAGLPRLGIIGAAYALCACYASALLMSCLGAWKYYGLPFPRMREMVATLVGAASICLVSRVRLSGSGLLHLGLSAGICALVYIVAFGSSWVFWRRMDRIKESRRLAASHTTITPFVKTEVHE